MSRGVLRGFFRTCSTPPWEAPVSDVATPSPENTPPAGTARRWRVSLDWWAVLASLALSVLVRSGAIQTIPW